MSEREACKPCGGRGWVVGECHPQEPCALCNGIGFFPGELAFADRDAWRARAEKAEADLRDANEWRDKLADKIIELEAATSRGRELVDDANERATQAEAQAAAMREMIDSLVSTYECEHVPMTWSPKHRAIFEGNAGRTLLAELEALREVATTGEAFARIVADGYMTWPEMEAFRAALARWKPLRGDK